MRLRHLLASECAHSKFNTAIVVARRNPKPEVPFLSDSIIRVLGPSAAQLMCLCHLLASECAHGKFNTAIVFAWRNPKPEVPFLSDSIKGHVWGSGPKRTIGGR